MGRKLTEEERRERRLAQWRDYFEGKVKGRGLTDSGLNIEAMGHSREDFGTANSDRDALNAQGVLLVRMANAISDIYKAVFAYELANEDEATEQRLSALVERLAEQAIKRDEKEAETKAERKHGR